MPDFGFDEWLDAQLRNVPVPRDWHERLAANRPPSDDELDAMVRDVDVPPHLERHLKRIAWQTRMPLVWRRLGLAASVLLAVTAVGYFALVRERDELQPRTVAKQVPPKPAARSSQVVAKAEPAQSEPKAPSPRQEPITVQLGKEPLVADDASRTPPITMQDVANVSETIKQAIDARVRAEQALGASGKIQRLPDLAALESPLARGVSPPRLRGYDMLFQLRHGEHPFVSPAAHRLLRVSRVPFTFRTTSYDLAEARVADGQLPAAEEIRVEDFLAAQRYALPRAPAGGVALHTAASPSPLGEPGLHLLQVAVQGGQSPSARHKPVRLIAVVDTSAAMEYDARWKVVQRGLANLARQMSGRDRLTLIGFAETPRVLAEDATAAELEALLASGALAATAGPADLASAIQSACEAVQAVASNETRKVVFITSGRTELGDAGQARSRESLLQLAAANIPWQIIRTAPTDDEKTLADLARRANGRAHDAASADELYGILLEALTGRPQIVAQGVSMRITFNPKAVTSYRMLGHESATLTGEAGDPLQIDLHAEQTATAMYEMWLKPSDEPQVAMVELLWRDPRNGQPRRNVRPIRRDQIAASFPQAPPWLQQGILAASTAEFLRGSYYVPRSRRLDQLHELGDEVDARAARIPEFQALIRLIDQAGNLR